MKIKLLLTACIFHSLCCKVFAQAYYMHEAAEDSDGNPIDGIIGLLLLIGLGVLIDKLWGKSKKENCDNEHYDDYDQTNVDNDDVFDQCFDEDVQINNFNIPLNSSVISSVKKKENNSFEEKVIGLYGNQIERFGGLLIIKEDGEYHYLSEHSDERYKILDSYLLEHKPHNCTDTTIT